jgi:hypothetical protein
MAVGLKELGYFKQKQVMDVLSKIFFDNSKMLYKTSKQTILFQRFFHKKVIFNVYDKLWVAVCSLHA